VLAAHGSGSVEASLHLDGPVVNLDIGGGTTKLSFIRDGVIEATHAINIGARLVATDREGRVVRVEPAGRALGAQLGIDCSPGVLLPANARDRIASEMAAILVQFLGFGAMSPFANSLMLGSQPDRRDEPLWLMCSGGVSEFVYGRSEADPLDLGPALGSALRGRLEGYVGAERLLVPREGIRATVIGASQFSLQASGETVFVSECATLPVANVPVLGVPLDWTSLSASGVKRAIATALAQADEPQRCALFFGGPKLFGYAAVAHVAQGILNASSEWPQLRDAVFVFSHNIANTMGRQLAAGFGPRAGFICLDEIEVTNLDYLDVGAFPPDERYLPVIVKSLVFGAGHRHGPQRAVESTSPTIPLEERT
jgi:ethanolamine utilization protein EutA